MRKPTHKSLLLLFVLAACTQKPALSPGDRAKYTAELIDKRAECAVYSKRLSSPNNDEKTIQKVYEDAKAAYCIKPDV